MATVCTYVVYLLLHGFASAPRNSKSHFVLEPVRRWGEERVGRQLMNLLYIALAEARQNERLTHLCWWPGQDQANPKKQAVDRTSRPRRSQQLSRTRGYVWPWLKVQSSAPNNIGMPNRTAICVRVQQVDQHLQWHA